MSQYMTADHEPPNGAIPSDRIMATYPAPNEPKPEDHGPPNGGVPQGGPPAYTPHGGYMGNVVPPQMALAVPVPVVQRPTFSWYGAMTHAPAMLPTAEEAPVPAATQPLPQVQAQLPAAPAGPIPYEPPGQFGPGGRMHEVGGASYIFPSRHTTIYFVGDGVRPCDYEEYPFQFHYSKHQVPSNMKIRDLIRKLGCPPEAEKGVSEMRRLGGNRWRVRATHTLGERRSGQAIASVGWGWQRGDDNPVWLVVKR